MWNSNSLVAWLLASSGHDTDSVDLAPPVARHQDGSAGLVVAARQRDELRGGVSRGSSMVGAEGLEPPTFSL